MQLNRDQLKQLKQATDPSHQPVPEQCADLLAHGLLDQDLRPTAAGLALLAREGFNTWEEDQERLRDWHSDHDPEP